MGIVRIRLAMRHNRHYREFPQDGEHSNVETICFIVMGLSVLVAFKPLYAIAEGTCYWMIAEGVCYITGAVFYSFRQRYMHSVFHFFVLAGSACHMVAVWLIL